MKKKKIVVIDRAKWGMDSLRDPDTKKQCCLGFACIDAGLDPRTIEGKEMPSFLGVQSIAKLAKSFPMLIRGTAGSPDSALADELAVINDDLSISLVERERMLNQKANPKGLFFKFVGEAPPKVLE